MVGSVKFMRNGHRCMRLLHLTLALVLIGTAAAGQGVPSLPIPGTGSVEHLEENVAAAELSLTDEEIAELDGAVD